MLRLRRPAKPVVAVLAAIVLALAISACAFVRENSLALSQAGGIGPVKVHFLLCTEEENNKCEPNESSGNLQYLLGIAVPKGSAAPATVTATPLSSGTAPIVFSRNDQVAAEMAAASAKLVAEEPNAKPWPPAGLEGIGYLSAPRQEVEGPVEEWSVDAEFGLPAAADGGSFPGPFASGIAFGSREVTPAHPANAPVHCWRFEGGPAEGEALCTSTIEEALIATSDLHIRANAPVTKVFVGGRALVPYSLDYASTASVQPALGFSAGTTLPGGLTTAATPGFATGPLSPTTHRAPTTTATVTVAVPKHAKPGLYEVSLTGTASGGGSSSAVAKLEVTKPKLKLGKVKLNRKTGTAILPVTVPAAGVLTVKGKSIRSVTRRPKKAQTLRITIKARGKAKGQLREAGKAKIKAKVTYRSVPGTPVSKTKSIVLKQG